MAVSEYLTLGRGEMYFAPFAIGTKVPGAYKFLGNCPAFNLNVAVESLEHFSSTSGIKEEDLSVVVSRQIGGTIECDDMKPQNQAFFFLGSETALTVGADTGITELLPATEFGGVYQIGVSDTNPTGDRNLLNVVVTDTATGLVTYVLGTDYTLDAVRGQITFISGGTITEVDDATVDYDIGTSTRSQVVSGQNQIEGQLMFKANNAVGKDVDHFLPNVQLRPEGDLQMIGEEFRTMSLSIKALTLAPRAAVYADDQAIA